MRSNITFQNPIGNTRDVPVAVWQVNMWTHADHWTRSPRGKSVHESEGAVRRRDHETRPSRSFPRASVAVMSHLEMREGRPRESEQAPGSHGPPTVPCPPPPVPHCVCLEPWSLDSMQVLQRRRKKPPNPRTRPYTRPPPPTPRLCGTTLRSLTKVGTCTKNSTWLSVHWAGQRLP